MLPPVCILLRVVGLFTARGFVADINDLVAANSDIPAPEGNDLHFFAAMRTFFLVKRTPRQVAYEIDVLQNQEPIYHGSWKDALLFY